MNYCIVTPWHNPEQKDKFLEAWGVNKIPDWLILQQDKDKSGCAKTKNAGVIEALNRKAETIIILDDDCGPMHSYYEYELPAFRTLELFAEAHMEALRPQPVELFEAVTDPPSRGTPYLNRTITMPVAASMGFWVNVPDYDSMSQLVHGPTKPMVFKRKTIFWRWFALSGMNLAFNYKWAEYAKFVDVPRFDDIWCGFKWQRKAYDAGYCFNLAGPVVKHMRQSNVLDNLEIEAPNIRRNENEWKRYATIV